MTPAGQTLATVDLPFAPPVVRATPAPLRRPRGPVIALVALGVVLAIGPIVGGLFSKAAAGQQMIQAFAPHMQADAFDRYHADIEVMRAGASGVESVYGQEGIPTGQFPRLDAYRQQSAAINDRAADLLARIEAAEPDYRRVSAIGGFDRIPFLIALSGIVAVYGGCVLLAGRRSRTKPTIVLVVAASLAVAAFPVVSNFDRGAHAGHRLLGALGVVMHPAEVRQLQRDFVIVVEGVGELDTGFRQVPQSGAAADAIAALVHQWPAISSDLATLVGTINDNLRDFNALNSLDRATGPVNTSGLEAFPLALAVLGIVGAALALASWPRRVKETS